MNIEEARRLKPGDWVAVQGALLNCLDRFLVGRILDPPYSESRFDTPDTHNHSVAQPYVLLNVRAGGINHKVASCCVAEKVYTSQHTPEVEAQQLQPSTSLCDLVATVAKIYAINAAIEGMKAEGGYGPNAFYNCQQELQRLADDCENFKSKV